MSPRVLGALVALFAYVVIRLIEFTIIPRPHDVLIAAAIGGAVWGTYSIKKRKQSSAGAPEGSDQTA